MKALAEQIGQLDGVEVYGRVVGMRGLMVEVAGPIHEMSAGAWVETDKAIPCEGRGIFRRQRAADAVRGTRRRAPGLRRGGDVGTRIPRPCSRGCRGCSNGASRWRNSSPKVRKKQPVLGKDINALSKSWVVRKQKTNNVGADCAVCGRFARIERGVIRRRPGRGSPEICYCVARRA